jgi:RNA polymerase sigma-70 factor (ECF subfamily)
MSDAHEVLLAALVGRHRHSLLQHVKRILCSDEDAEDVVQETCMRLLRVGDLCRGDREVRAFLFKVATNLARDELRRRKARCHGMHLPHDTIDLSDELRPDEIVDRDLIMRVVSGAVLRLSARHRQVFNLYMQGHMSYRAIADRLGVSAKTVERDMFEAQELCQDRLRPRGKMSVLEVG